MSCWTALNTTTVQGGVQEVAAILARALQSSPMVSRGAAIHGAAGKDKAGVRLQ